MGTEATNVPATATPAQPTGDVRFGVVWYSGVKWHPNAGRPRYYADGVWNAPNAEHPAPDFNTREIAYANGRIADPGCDGRADWSCYAVRDGRVTDLRKAK